MSLAIGEKQVQKVDSRSSDTGAAFIQSLPLLTCSVIALKCSKECCKMRLLADWPPNTTKPPFPCQNNLNTLEFLGWLCTTRESPWNAMRKRPEILEIWDVVNIAAWEQPGQAHESPSSMQKWPQQKQTPALQERRQLLGNFGRIFQEFPCNTTSTSVTRDHPPSVMQKRPQYLGVPGVCPHFLIKLGGAKNQ